MKTFLVALAAVIVTALGITAVRAEGLDFSAGVTGSSERIFRGYSITGGQPGAEIWAELDYEGFYARVISGNRAFDATLTDFDVNGTLGVRHTLLGILFDAGATYSYFGGADPCFPNPDYLEFHLAAATELLGFNVAAAARFSPDYIFSTGDAWRYEGGISRQLVDVNNLFAVSVFGSAGHNDTQFADWQDVRAGVQLDRGPFFARAYYSTTTGDNLGHNADSRAVFEVGANIN